VDREPPRVLLVSPPWTTLGEPSLGLAILKSTLEEQGVACRVLHLNLFATEFLRQGSYWALARVFALNDFLFSGVLDATVTTAQLRILRQKCQELVADGSIDPNRFGGLDGVAEQLLKLRSETIPAWIDKHARRMLAWQPTLIGFTCMFDQTIASVAIAHRLRELGGTATIALGGYAVRPPTGEAVLTAFPWIDAVCVGEGEPVIGALARESAKPEPDLTAVPSLLYRTGSGRIAATPAAPLMRMDDVPIPNYDDFFADVRELDRDERVRVPIDRLPVENSRGCWWGAIHHCVFCGIHDDDLFYRQRSPERVLATMAALSERYGWKGFRFADYILPDRYYQTLLPELIRMGAPYELKCEIKANVDEERMRKLAEAGFVEIQPGIESFADEPLLAMDKGVSAAQNVYLLVLARKYGVVIHYNLLYGFPDDAAAVYREMAERLPSLRHLDPPSSRMRVQITRYAPLQADPKRFGIPAARHERSYRLIFSSSYLAESGFNLDDYCYIFELPFEPPPRLSRLYRRIDGVCDEWKRAYPVECNLVSEPAPDGGAVVTDTREPGSTRVVQLSPDERTVLTVLAQPRTWKGLIHETEGKLVADSQSSGIAERDDAPAVDSEKVPQLDEIVARLDSLGLIFRDSHRLVSLVLPKSEIAPKRHWWDNYPTRFTKLEEQEQ
jgi:ribosomal peptide maturation radical SAM protein 1